MQTAIPSKHSSWWRRLEDVFRLRLQKASWRRLRNVFIKTNMFALALRLHKTSSRRLQDVLVKTNIFVLAIRLQDVFKTSSRPTNVCGVGCGFIPKCVCYTIRTYSQMRCTDKHSQHSSSIWSVWLNGWVFVYELSGCGFESRWSHLIFRYRVCFE